MSSRGRLATAVNERRSRTSLPAGATRAPTVTANGKRVGRPPKSAEEKRTALNTKAADLAERIASAQRAGDTATRDKLIAQRERVAAQYRKLNDTGESVHTLAARLRAEQSLPEEVKPGAKLEARAEEMGSRNDPFATHGEMASTLLRTYGEQQVGAALQAFSHNWLKEAAGDLGVTPGRGKDETISRLTVHLTNGRYSANFDKSAKKAPATRAKTPETNQIHAGEFQRPSRTQARANREMAFGSTRQRSTPTPATIPSPAAPHPTPAPKVGTLDQRRDAAQDLMSLRRSIARQRADAARLRIPAGGALNPLERDSALARMSAAEHLANRLEAQLQDKLARTRAQFARPRSNS